MAKSIRHTLLALAIGALPVLAAAQNYPSTTTQQPAATPSASPSTNMQNSTMGKSANSDYGQAIAACEQKPMSERVACRQAADSKFGKGGGGNTQGDASTSGNATGGTTGSTTGSSGNTTGSATGSTSSGMSGTTSGSASGTGTSGTSGTSGTGSSSGGTK